MRLQRLISRLLLLYPIPVILYARLSTTLSRHIPCNTGKQQLRGHQSGDELLQSSRSAAAESGCGIGVARTAGCGCSGGENCFNNSGGTIGRKNSGRHNSCVTADNESPSGPFEFRTPWKDHLTGCREVPGQQVLLLQQTGVNHIAPFLLRFFGVVHSAFHLPELLKRLKNVQHIVNIDEESRRSGGAGWWSFGREWDAAVPLLRYCLSFLPFLLLLFASLLLLLTYRSGSSGTVAAATKAAKTVSQARGTNSDAAYAALLLLLPVSCSKESQNSGKRCIMLLLLIIATAAVAATLAATAADSLKAASCEAPLAFEAFSGLQQEHQQTPMVKRGLYGILEGLRQLPTEWECTAPAAIAAVRGHTTTCSTSPAAARAAPGSFIAASDLQVLLHEGAMAAKQLKKSWLGSQYVVLLQAETKVPQLQQQQQLPGETLWRRSERFLSPLLALCRWGRCNVSAGNSSSGSRHRFSPEASSRGSDSAYSEYEHFSFMPISVHDRTSLGTHHLQEKQKFTALFGKQQQGSLRCMGAEKLADAASEVGDALDNALKQHMLMQQFADDVLEPHQLVHQKEQLLQVQQHVEDALHHELPQLWKFVGLLLQASSISVEEVLRRMPLLLLTAAFVAAAAAGASLVRHLAAEQPVGKLYAACRSFWRVFGSCCCIAASLLLLAAAVSADSANLVKSMLQDSTMLPRYFPLGNGALERMLLQSMEQYQDSFEDHQQQNSAVLLPIPKTQELEQLVETLASGSHRSRALWDSVSMLQLHLEGRADADWLYYPAPSQPGFSISLSASNRDSSSSSMGYQELLLELRKLTGVNWAFSWGPLPEGCVNPEPFQKTRATTTAWASAAAAGAAARAAARTIQKQLSRLIPQRRSKQQQMLPLRQRPAPCYFVSQDVEDKDLLSRFGLLIAPKSTARLLSIFSLARRVDAARAFIEKRSKADVLFLQQVAAGVQALEVLVQRSTTFAELLRPLAHLQRHLEQENDALKIRYNIARADATTTTGFVLCCFACFLLLFLVVVAFSLARFYGRRYEALLLLGALRECEARRVQQLQEDLCFSDFSRVTVRTHASPSGPSGR